MNITLDDVVLSLFPALMTTHMKHAVGEGIEEQSHSLLFPYDRILAVLAVTYCRYTVCYQNESKLSRLFWSLVLGCCSYQRYDYWFQGYIHVVSFSVFMYETLCSYYINNQNKKDGSTSTVSFSSSTKTAAASSATPSLEDMTKKTQVMTVLGTLLLALGHLLFSWSYPMHEHSLFQSKLYEVYVSPMLALLPSSVPSDTYTVWKLVSYLLPLDEFQQAHDIIVEFVSPAELYAKGGHLLFVTFHIQVGMGYLGISFLREEQSRKNALVKIEDEVKRINGENTNGNVEIAAAANKKKKTKQQQQRNDTNNNNQKNKKTDAKPSDPSKKFRNSAGPFIFLVALPYMFQIVLYGGLNMYAFHCFRDDIHRTIRLTDLFHSHHDGKTPDGSRFVATATSKLSNLSPESYASNAETVVTTVYEMINRNLFSVPKLLLLPGIVAKQPLLLLKITPLILFSDWIKSTIVASITNEVERINKEVKDLESMRTKVEQYDLKNSELIQRSGQQSILFTERKWMSLTEDIQDKQARTSLMTRSKMYFAGLQRHFIMMALVDCALAKLIAVGKIGAADIFVYARAIEDMINFVLMKSRSESELATMQTSIEVLHELKSIWEDSAERNVLECTTTTTDDSKSKGNEVSLSSSTLNIQGLSYTRGSAAVSIDNLSLSSGIYAVTGANGSGKSTLFRVIMGCNTNAESVDVHSSIEFTSQGHKIQMPSSDVVEITQNFYFPLFSAPFDWIYNIDVFDNDDNGKGNGKLDNSTKAVMATRLEDELKSLNFYPETLLLLQQSTEDKDDKSLSSSNTTTTSSTLQSDLTTSKDDWFLDLSGGQKSKVELVRKVFLAERCPAVLLIDETFAPLDPDSKNLVMQKLKTFCRHSIVLVIYHADVKKNIEGSTGSSNGNGSGSNGSSSSTSEDPNGDDDLACVESSNFFDNNIHVENGSLILRPVCAAAAAVTEN